MQLLSFNFVYFVAAVFLVFLFTPARFRWFTVLLAGYIFYGSVNPLYLLFLIIPTAVVYLAGRGLSGPKKRIVLFGGIVLPLGLL